MLALSIDTISDAFDAVGLRRGDTVLVFSDLSKAGVVPGTRGRSEFCATYLTALQNVLGVGGTIVVPTYTTQVARYGLSYDAARTPSIAGIFTEHVRLQPGAVRSLHPVHSLTALGAKSYLISGHNGLSDFGWASPFHRLHQEKARILSIGLSAGYALGIAHYLEAMCDLPYVYNKLLRWPVFVDGVQLNRDFIGIVRHLGLNFRYEFTPWAKALYDRGFLCGRILGRSAIFCSDFAQAFDMAEQQLRSNPYYMLQSPPDFVQGVLPYDGSTKNKDGMALPTNSYNPDRTNWVGSYLGQKAVVTAPELDERIAGNSK